MKTLHVYSIMAFAIAAAIICTTGSERLFAKNSGPFQAKAEKPQIENVIVVTTDGFRWQEVFRGVDSSITSIERFNQFKKAYIFEHFGGKTAAESRAKLLPFFWGTIAKEGVVYGNRDFGNNVNVTNPYWFSYPGYSELFCGYVDTLINSNHYKENPNTNVFEFINRQPGFKDKVAAFAEWGAFANILNAKRSGIPVVCGQESAMPTGDSLQSILGQMKRDSYLPFDTEMVQDVFVQYAALDYLKKKAPRVCYISFGETDEWAHEGHYLDYLTAAHRVDKWLGELWYFIQHDPRYKNKTALIVTADHGRGDLDKKLWTSHKRSIPGSDQIWIALIGPGIAAAGESHAPLQLYQNQVAATIAELLGLHFTCEHAVAPSLYNK